LIRHTKKGILTILLIFTILLSLNSLIGSSHQIQSDSSSDDENNVLDFTYSFSEPELSFLNISQRTFTKVTMENLSSSTFPGKPNLPIKTISILLPPNTEFKNVSFSEDSEKIFLNYPVQINEGKSTNTRIEDWFEDNERMNDFSIMPSEPIEFVGIGKMKGYHILYLNLHPCRYNSSDDSLHFSKHISFMINVIEKNQDHSLYRNYINDERYITDIVENPSMLLDYEKLCSSNSQCNTDESETYSYIIITSDELEPHFNSLITYKKQYISARSVNFSFINQRFYGKDMQQKIRECIKYAYGNWQTEYVLLGGDVSVIPYRGLWGEAIDHEGSLLQDNAIPSDLYYAGLDGSWDLDNDRIYGEDALHSISDESDFFTEVSVGRAPVENKAEIGTFINKIISFETADKPQKVLLHQSGINVNNNPDSTVIAEHCAQWIPSHYEIDRLYQKDESISSAEWMSRFSDNNLIVQHTGNGEYDQYYVSWPTQVFTSYQSVSMLKNNFYPIHISVACNSGGFDHQDSIAETILLNPYGGASACLFNSRRGFTSNTNAHKYSGEMIEEHFRNLFYCNVDHIGKIHQLSKESFGADAMIDPAYRWVYYTFNLLGDPEMPVFEKRQDYLNSNHYYVDDDFSAETVGWEDTHFDTIQKGINAASDWDVVHVNAGRYNEYLSIKKTIRLIGENKKTTIIDGENGRGPIRINANRVTISGFTIKNDALSSDSCRMYVTNSNYITISDCIISDNQVGVYAVETTNLFIVNSKFIRNEKSLYFPMRIGTVYISNNDFVFDDFDTYGIYGMANGEYVLHNNTFLSKSEFSKFTCAAFMHGKAMIKDNEFSDCTIGAWLIDGEGIIENNLFSNNDHIGFYAESSTVIVSFNVFENNGNNWISYQHGFDPGGLILNGDGGLSCVITNNVLKDNRGYGVFLKGYFGLDNKVSNNDFIDNSIHAFFRNSYCSWNNNFWQKNRVFPKVIYGVLETPYFFNIPFLNADFMPRSHSSFE